jgi:hypothetical protein
LSFSLVQHLRDLELIQKIKECWGLGIISISSSIARLTVTKKIWYRYFNNSIFKL